MSYVYVVQADNGPIKIGFSKEPCKRVRMFQACSPNVISVIAVTRGGLWLETTMKLRWSKQRMWGEWFRPSADIFADIEVLKDQGAPAFMSPAAMRLDGDVPLHRIVTRYGFTKAQLREWMQSGIPDCAAQIINSHPPLEDIAPDSYPRHCAIPVHHEAFNTPYEPAPLGEVCQWERRRPGRTKSQKEAA